MFEHIAHNPITRTVKRKVIDGKRHYVDFEDNIYYSVTQVTDTVGDKKGLEVWRKKVGEDVANYVMREARNNGTRLHSLCEDYLYNKDLKFKDILSKGLFENIKPSLEVINQVRGLEVQMCSPRMGVAGTADCIAEYNGELAVIDFKTTSKKKPEDWILNYFIQSTIYAMMWEENTGEEIPWIIIIFTGKDMSNDVYIKKTADYKEQAMEIIAKFRLEHDTL